MGVNLLLHCLFRFYDVNVLVVVQLKTFVSFDETTDLI